MRDQGVASLARVIALVSLATLGVELAMIAVPGGMREARAATGAAGYRQALDTLAADPGSATKAADFMEQARRVNPHDAAGDLSLLSAAYPDIAGLKVDLAELQARTGALTEARRILETVLTVPSLSEMTRVRAEDMLSRLRAADDGWSYSGSLLASGRYESNPGAVPSDVLARLPNRLVGDIDDLFADRADYSGVAVGSLQGLVNLGALGGVQFEANLLGYGTRYGKDDDLNLNLLSADIGPRFQVETPGVGLWSVRPYVSAAYLALRDTEYLRALGAGLNLRAYIGASVLADATADIVHKNYRRSDSYPEADGRSGYRWSVEGGLNWELSPSTLLFGHAAFADSNAERDYLSYRETSVTVGISQRHRAPFGLTVRPWVTTLALGLRHTLHDAPHPGLDPDTARDDMRRAVSLTTRVPVTNDVSVVLVAQRQWTASTIKRFDRSGTAASIGVAWRF